MSRKYSNFRAIYLSFFSRDLYMDVARNWKGTGLAYLFISLTVLLLIPTFFGTIQLSGYVNDDEALNRNKDKPLFGTALTLGPIIDFIDQFPELIIENGKLTTYVEQPYHIFVEGAHSGKKEDFFIIDTTGKVKDFSNNKASLLITDKYFMTREDNGEKNIRLEFSEVLDTVINRDVLLGWIKWQPLAYFPGVLFMHFFVYSINAIIFGLLGFGLCRFLKVDLSYSENIRLAVVTTTPIIFLEILAAVLGMQLFTKPTLIYLFAHAAYMYHAVESNKKQA